MKIRFLSISLLLSVAVNLAWAEGATYRWVDENGVVHYGDSVPPQYAKKERHVLNKQGVRVGTLEAEKTPEQLAEEARLRVISEENMRREEIRRRNDQILLDTYLSVAEIELLRDRRLELLQAQENITNQYLDTLRVRMAELEEDSQAFKPYSASESAPPIPENLAKDLINTLESINNYERRLANNRQEQALLRNQFERDIGRFRQLKRLQHAAGTSAGNITPASDSLVENAEEPVTPET